MRLFLHKLRVIKSDKKDKKDRIKLINAAIKEGKKFYPSIEYVKKNKLNVLAATSCKSKGIKRGLITDFELASITIKQAFNEIEDMLGFKINKVIASVPSYLAEYSIIKSSIEIDSSKTISSKEVMKVLEKSISSKSLDGREMVTVLPIDFKINDSVAIKDPVGLNGSKLSTRAVLVTVPKKNVYSVVGLLEKIGIEVVDISINNIGDLYSFKNNNFEDKISAIINVGAETTSISIFNRSVIVKSAILNVGAKNIDQDISYTYKIDLETANKLKHKYVVADKMHASSNETVDCKNKNGEVIKINQYEISEVVESRVKEILNLAKNELNSLTSKRIDYIIITGGMSNMAGFEYAAYDIFGKNINIGTMKMIGVRNNKYSSVIGNIVYFISKLKLKGQNYTMIDDGDYSAMASADSTRNAPDSTLGKIFGYFFND